MLWLPGIALLLFEQIRFPQPLRLELISVRNAVAARHAAQVHIGTMFRGRKRGRKPKICDTATAKRIRCAVENGVAVTTACKLLSNAWESPELLSAREYECFRDGPDKMWTKYGKVVQTIRIPLEDGGTFEGPYICPMALLSWATGICPPYGCFLQQCFNGRIGNLCFHVDEATLGNMLRPAPGREFQSISYTFADIPDWYRTRETGYIPLCILPAQTLDGKNMSSVWRSILDVCFSEFGFNLEKLE